MTTHPVIDALRDALESVPPDASLTVCFSGGMDSHVLLHGLKALSAEHARALRAVHVHHGLQPGADVWQAHCQSVCDELGVPLTAVRVKVDGDAGRGPEDAARQSRYRAFAEHLGRDDVLCLAHHADDQAETFLLQLLRGAGPKGLSAMPRFTGFAGGALLRPLLSLPRSAIREYAETCKLSWVEDSSNADSRFDRNYLRNEIMPALLARWPGAVRTIARAAAHQAAMARVVEGMGHAVSMTAAADSGTLDCRTLGELDPEVAALAVRAWLSQGGFPPPSTTLMGRILDEVLGAGEDANPLVAWSGVEVRRYRGRLYAMPTLIGADTATVVPWNPPEALELPHGRLEAAPASGSGLDAERCARGVVEVRFRRGGERCKPAGQAQSSTLKYWFQQRGVPPWERDRTPLIFIDGDLAAVAGAWICEGFESRAENPGWLLSWRTGPARDAGRIISGSQQRRPC